MGTGNFLWKFLKRSFTAGLISVTVSDRCFSVGIIESSPTSDPTHNSHVNNSEIVEFVLVEKFCLQKYKFSLGDVVACWSPSDHTEIIVQRIIGLPGDRVFSSRLGVDDLVPKGYCWIVGETESSLHLGPIPLGLIHGRVTHIVWPPKKMGKRIDNIV